MRQQSSCDLFFLRSNLDLWICWAYKSQGNSPGQWATTLPEKWLRILYNNTSFKQCCMNLLRKLQALQAHLGHPLARRREMRTSWHAIAISGSKRYGINRRPRLPRFEWWPAHQPSWKPVWAQTRLGSARAPLTLAENGTGMQAACGPSEASPNQLSKWSLTSPAVEVWRKCATDSLKYSWDIGLSQHRISSVSWNHIGYRLRKSLESNYVFLAALQLHACVLQPWVILATMLWAMWAAWFDLNKSSSKVKVEARGWRVSPYAVFHKTVESWNPSKKSYNLIVMMWVG